MLSLWAYFPPHFPYPSSMSLHFLYFASPFSPLALAVIIIIILIMILKSPCACCLVVLVSLSFHPYCHWVVVVVLNVLIILVHRHSSSYVINLWMNIITNINLSYKYILFIELNYSIKINLYTHSFIHSFGFYSVGPRIAAQHKY